MTHIIRHLRAITLFLALCQFVGMYLLISNIFDINSWIFEHDTFRMSWQFGFILLSITSLRRIIVEGRNGGKPCSDYELDRTVRCQDFYFKRKNFLILVLSQFIALSFYLHCTLCTSPFYNVPLY